MKSLVFLAAVAAFVALCLLLNPGGSENAVEAVSMTPDPVGDPLAPTRTPVLEAVESGRATPAAPSSAVRKPAERSPSERSPASEPAASVETMLAVRVLDPDGYPIGGASVLVSQLLVPLLPGTPTESFSASARRRRLAAQGLKGDIRERFVAESGVTDEFGEYRAKIQPESSW